MKFDANEYRNAAGASFDRDCVYQKLLDMALMVERIEEITKSKEALSEIAIMKRRHPDIFYPAYSKRHFQEAA